MDKTLILLSKLLQSTSARSLINYLKAFDEAEDYSIPNQVFSILLGDAVPASSEGSSDSTAYSHYSQLATVENNWSLGNLGLGDVDATPFF